MLKTWLIVLVVMSVFTPAQSQNIELVDRSTYQDILSGIVDFDGLGAPIAPLTFLSKFRQEGANFAHSFSGQIGIMRQAGPDAHSLNYGRPNAPLGIDRNPSGTLRIVTKLADGVRNGVLESICRDFVPARGPLVQTSRPIVIHFSDKQFVFGFELVTTDVNDTVVPEIIVRFFDVDGELVGSPMTFNELGEYTFLAPRGARRVSGVEITNRSRACFGLDNVVFELPIIIG